jgi:uncharacterized protein (DUF1330 family)
MSVYIVAQLRVTDRAAYDRYQARFPGVLARSRGRLLAADEAAKVLEGHWTHEKLVLLEFPDELSARSFIQSPAYQNIALDRKRGTETLALLVRGRSRTMPLDEDSTVPGVQ